MLLLKNQHVCKFQSRTNAKSKKMDQHFHVGAWIGELKSDALIVVIVVVAVVGYVAATGRSPATKKRSKRNKPVPFRKIVQGKIQLDKSNKAQVLLENAVVIGGSGYLGKRLVKQLIDDGNYLVHSLDLIIPPNKKRDPSVWSYIQTDITNKEHVVEALRDMDVVFHTASLIPITVDITDDDMHNVNVIGTQNIIEACKMNNVKRLIYTSSSCVALSRNPNKICENVEESQSLPDNPMNTYVKTKGSAEMMALDANNQGGVHTCALRLAGLLGGTDNKLMDSFMSSCIVQFTSGQSRISWIGVDSAANAHIVADKRLREETSNNNNYKGSTPQSDNQIAGRAFNISITDQFKINELYQFFAEKNGKPLIVLPLWIVKGLVNINVYVYKKTGVIPFYAYLSPACFEFLQSHFTVSTERARKDLGWEESRPWKEVIGELIKEYKAESSQLKLK